MDFPGSALPGLAKESKKAIEYWRKYKGRTVRIEETELEVSEAAPQDSPRTVHGVEGTVSEVMALPPGFLLEDAEYFFNPERLSPERVPEGGLYTYEKGEMFVSFDSIERMVFVED